MVYSLQQFPPPVCVHSVCGISASVLCRVMHGSGMVGTLHEVVVALRKFAVV